MKPINAHITLDGEPICTTALCKVHGHKCGHKSLRSARTTARELWKLVWWKRIKVVRGDCPAI